MQDKIIICPREEKIRLLKESNKEKELQSMKYLTKEEFFEKYYFSYDEKAIYYLMNKYHWHIDVVRTYLSYLYVVEENKTYHNPKIEFLKNLKIELKEAGYLEEDPIFQKNSKKKEILVKNYYNLDLYEEKILPVPEYSSSTITTPVHVFTTLEEEINNTCIEIIKLLKKGISINNIYLGNIQEEDYYLIEKIFSYYHIPITIPYKNSIYSSKTVQDYLAGKEIENNEITKKLYNVLNHLVEINLEDEVGRAILIDALKHAYYDTEEYKDSVHIINIFNEEFKNDEYVFVLGFNQDILPRMKKDIEYITDKDKVELDLYSTEELNKREKESTIYVLSHIKNLYLSYRKKSSFNEYYPSSLIEELGLETIKEHHDSYEYSNYYNQIRLAKELDRYYLYGEKSEILDSLLSTYQIPYREYDSSFTGINQEEYQRNLSNPFRLSYTAINTYHKCQFKYYLQKVLNLNLYEDNFSSYIGSMYHKILSLYREESFDIEEEFQKYLEKRECSFKEKMFLIRIKKDLIALIDVLKKQDLLTGFNDILPEQPITIPITEDHSVEFIGFIDKIMYYQKIEDTYFSIVDYKTGTIDTHIEPMKYGLHMQLPVYLYLIHYGNIFKKPLFTGIYYQNILFSYPNWSKNLEKENKEKYYLQGYSTDNIERLERFDSTYEDSEMIKSMKYKEEKFDRYTKIIDDDLETLLVDYTKKKIEETTNKILDASFTINPKVYKGKNISCEFCSFRDICYRKEKDSVYLDTVEDLSFLKGEC